MAGYLEPTLSICRRSPRLTRIIKTTTTLAYIGRIRSSICCGQSGPRLFRRRRMLLEVWRNCARKCKGPSSKLRHRRWFGNSSHPPKLQQCLDHGRSFARCGRRCRSAAKILDKSSQFRAKCRLAGKGNSHSDTLRRRKISFVQLHPRLFITPGKHSIGAMNTQLASLIGKARRDFKNQRGISAANADQSNRAALMPFTPSCSRWGNLTQDFHGEGEIVGGKCPNGVNVRSRAGPVCSRRVHEFDLSDAALPNKGVEEPNCRMIAPDVHDKDPRIFGIAASTDEICGKWFLDKYGGSTVYQLSQHAGMR